jgi:hypothetical protein
MPPPSRTTTLSTILEKKKLSLSHKKQIIADTLNATPPPPPPHFELPEYQDTKRHGKYPNQSGYTHTHTHNPFLVPQHLQIGACTLEVLLVMVLGLFELLIVSHRPK